MARFAQALDTLQYFPTTLRIFRNVSIRPFESGVKVSRFSTPDPAPLSLWKEDPERREWIDHTVDAVIHPAKHAWEHNM